jgi:hypothetical protein
MPPSPQRVIEGTRQGDHRAAGPESGKKDSCGASAILYSYPSLNARASVCRLLWETIEAAASFRISLQFLVLIGFENSQLLFASAHVNAVSRLLRRHANRRAVRSSAPYRSSERPPRLKISTHKHVVVYFRKKGTSPQSSNSGRVLS